MNPEDTPSISGLRASELNSMVIQKLNNSEPIGLSYGAFAYDAIWSTAMALNLTSSKLKGAGEHVAMTTAVKASAHSIQDFMMHNLVFTSHNACCNKHY